MWHSGDTAKDRPGDTRHQQDPMTEQAIDEWFTNPAVTNYIHAGALLAEAWTSNQTAIPGSRLHTISTDEANAATTDQRHSMAVANELPPDWLIAQLNQAGPQ